MEQHSKHPGWHVDRQGSTGKNGACVKLNAGKLIQFAQLSRDTAAALQIEKSLHETSLKINKVQEAARLQLGMRLHHRLDRSLALIKSNGTDSASSLEVHVQQIRTHLSQVYPTALMMEIPKLKSAPPSGRSLPIASD
jgi:hypothetical protein